MTIEELRQILDCFPDDATVIFSPDDYCSSGYPEWEYVEAKVEANSEVPCGKLVTVLLKGERSE